MMQRIFIIAAGVLALIAIGAAVYFFFFRSTPTLTGTPAGNGFNQTGTDTTFSKPSTLDVGQALPNAGDQIAPRLIRITKEPVAYGAVAFSSFVPASSASSTGTSTPRIPDTEIRYVERASGNIYSYLVKARTLTRLSNRTLPGVVEAAWLSDGSKAFVRFLTANPDTSEQIDTYALPFDGNGGYLLQKNLKEVATLGTSSIFSLLTGDNGSIGTVAKPDGTGNKTIFSSLLSSIRVFPTRAGYFAATDPAATAGGYAFKINAATGNFERILGPLSGLSILPSPQGDQLLISYIQNGTPQLVVVSVATRTPIALPLSTLADKCVWSRDELSIYCGVPTNLSGNLPDDWFQGTVSFSDRLWKISLKDRLATLVIDPSTAGKTDIDMVALTTDSNNSVIVFTNKKDLSLWEYSL